MVDASAKATVPDAVATAAVNELVSTLILPSKITAEISQVMRLKADRRLQATLRELEGVTYQRTSTVVHRVQCR